MFRMNLKTLKGLKGLTLIELLIAIAITSLLCLGIPGMTHMLARQQLRNSQGDLHLLINRTRQDALTLGTRITLCPLSTEGRCQQNWAGTISEFVDNNGNRSLDPGEKELARIEIHSAIQVSWRGMKPANSIHFSPMGRTFVSNGTFKLCHADLQETLKLIINRQGRTRSERTQQAC
ncbi:Type II transport protein GspH [compost metagenome]